MIRTYEEFIETIDSGVPFAFTRWGDGEWLNIRKSPGSNCDGNLYYHDLGDALSEIVETRQDYILGYQDTKWKLLSDVNKYPDQDWVDADVFHKASMENNLSPLIETLQNKTVVYIGNKGLSGLPFIDEFIEIPESNVWLNREEVLYNIKRTIDSNVSKVYCFSAGMATNVFIDRLWKHNRKQTYIDVGSVFDPYVGKITRTYHKHLNLCNIY